MKNVILCFILVFVAGACSPGTAQLQAQLDAQATEIAALKAERNAAGAETAGAAETHPPEPPPEKPATASGEGDPFQLAQPQPPQGTPGLGVWYNAQAAGTVGNTASYVNRNPLVGPCQGMCVRIINDTYREVPIAIFVDSEMQTVFAGFAPVTGPVQIPSSAVQHGIVSLLPYGTQTEWRMDRPGAHDIAVVALTKQNDGWYIPDECTVFSARSWGTFPIRNARFGYEQFVRGFRERECSRFVPGS